MNLDLIVLNMTAYGSLVAGVWEMRRQTHSSEIKADAAFPLLETSIKHAFPELQSGFTWREGISSAKGLGLDLRWDEIERDLSAYEAYRYGSKPEPQSPNAEIMKLAGILRRRGL